jgi:hypothetical protein
MWKPRIAALIGILFLWVLRCSAQTPSASPANKPMVNWLYGAYVPKNVPLVTLNAAERGKLFVVQSFISPGIYINTGFFTVWDQIYHEPEEWGDGLSGFGKRAASHHSQSLIQNSLSTLGNAALGYEPRYDQCKCDGTWHRMRHAIVRNFLTYNRTEKEVRPQLAMYGAAFSSGMISTTWKPERLNSISNGAHGMLNQAIWGTVTNMVGEFSPEIKRILKH